MPTNIWIGGATGTETSYSVAANWSLSAVPVNGDDVIIPTNATYAIAAGLNQSAVSLNSFTVQDGCGIRIGLDGTPLHITTSSANLGGTALSYLQIDGASSDIIVISAATSPGTGKYGLNISGLNTAGIDANLSTGQSIGIATGSGDSATFTAIRAIGGTIGIGNVVKPSPGGDVDVEIRGTTTAAKSSCNVGTLNTEASSYIVSAGTVTTLNGNGGTITYESTGAATTINLRDTVLNLSAGAEQPTNLNVYGGHTITDPFGVLVGAVINHRFCTPASGTLNLKANLSLTLAAL